MSRAEEFMNRLTDMDSGWWPFLKLRPSKDREMDNVILLRMTAHYGPFYGLLFAVAHVLLIQQFEVRIIVGWLAWMTVFIFVGYKYSFAIFWNRRARRLRKAAP
jgi:hypothetical protein